MPTQAFEESNYNGEPYELYHFVRGTEEWNYTDGILSRTHLSDTYTPLQISRTAPRQGKDDAPGSIDVTVPTDSPLGLVVQQAHNIRAIDLTVFSLQEGAPSATRIVFLGQLIKASIGPSDTIITCVPIAGQMSMQLPRGTMQRAYCVWTTYHALTCGVDPADFTFTGEVTAISGNGLTITVAGATAFVPGLPGAVALTSMFTRGVLIKGEQRGEIQVQLLDNMVLSERMIGLEIGDTVQLLAGDNRDPITCRDKFQNAERMLVHPNMPQVTPFFGQGFNR